MAQKQETMYTAWHETINVIKLLLICLASSLCWVPIFAWFEHQACDYTNKTDYDIFQTRFNLISAYYTCWHQGEESLFIRFGLFWSSSIMLFTLATVSHLTRVSMERTLYKFGMTGLEIDWSKSNPPSKTASVLSTQKKNKLADDVPYTYKPHHNTREGLVEDLYKIIQDIESNPHYFHQNGKINHTTVAKYAVAQKWFTQKHGNGAKGLEKHIKKLYRSMKSHGSS